MNKCLFCVLVVFALSCKKEQEGESFTPLGLPNGINVKEQGAKGDGVNDDGPAFAKAMSLANTMKLPVIIPIGNYKANISIPYDGISLVGQGQPGTSFKVGSIIIGSINCNNKKNITLQHIGINATGNTTAAALISGDGEDSVELNHLYDHISLLGSGYQQYNHGILCQTGRKIRIKNILVKNFYHGIALRSGNIQVDSIEAISCGFTSIVIKSAGGKNSRTSNIDVKHVNIQGNADNPYERGGMILIQSFDEKAITENISINTVFSRYGGLSAIAVAQEKGMVRNIKITNCVASYQGHEAGSACYEIKGGSDIFLSNCSSIRAFGTGFRCIGETKKVRAEQCYESGSGVRAWSGSFDYLQLNGEEIIK
jgi:hypothetical protein